MSVSDLPSDNPLKQFQGFKFNKEGITQLLTSINSELDNPIIEPRLLRLIDWSWPEFYDKLKTYEEEAIHYQNLNEDNFSVEDRRQKGVENYYFNQIQPTLSGVKNASNKKEYTSKEDKIKRIQETVINVVKETSLASFGTERPPLLSPLSVRFSGTPLPCKICEDDIEVVDGGCKFCGLDCHIWIKKPTETSRGIPNKFKQ
jgi:hypothetical protein